MFRKNNFFKGLDKGIFRGWGLQEHFNRLIGVFPCEKCPMIDDPIIIEPPDPVFMCTGQGFNSIVVGVGGATTNIVTSTGFFAAYIDDDNILINPASLPPGTYCIYSSNATGVPAGQITTYGFVGNVSAYQVTNYNKMSTYIPSSSSLLAMPSVSNNLFLNRYYPANMPNVVSLESLSSNIRLTDYRPNNFAKITALHDLSSNLLLEIYLPFNFPLVTSMNSLSSNINLKTYQPSGFPLVTQLQDLSNNINLLTYNPANFNNVTSLQSLSNNTKLVSYRPGGFPLVTEMQELTANLDLKIYYVTSMPLLGALTSVYKNKKLTTVSVLNCPSLDPLSVESFLNDIYTNNEGVGPRSLTIKGCGTPTAGWNALGALLAADGWSVTILAN